MVPTKWREITIQCEILMQIWKEINEAELQCNEPGCIHLQGEDKLANGDV